MEKMIVGVEEEVLIRAVALLDDIHRHLKAGKTIEPDNKTVLMVEAHFTAEDRAFAPTLTEYIGGVLKEIKADEILK